MSSTAYLCVTGIGRLYPSARDPRFDPARHTIAAGAGAVPLLWFALFRPGDLKRQSVRPIDGGPEDAVDALAPIAPVDRAVNQLTAAVPALDELFGGRWGSFAGQAKLLGAALRSAGLAYVTIELDEVEAGQDAVAYRENMRRVLRFFDAPEKEIGAMAGGGENDIVATFARMCALDPAADAEANARHIIGARHERPVPWEK